MFATKNGEIAAGVWLVIFGLVKTVVGAMALAYEPARVAMTRMPVVGLMIENDSSFAGVYAEIILVLFGIYSLLHGAVILGLTRGRLARLYYHPSFFAGVNFAFAAALILFYSLVLFTRAPIQQSDAYRGHYWLLLATGVAFLAVPVGLLWWQAVKEGGLMFSVSTLALVVLLLVTILLLRIAFRFKKNKMAAAVVTLVTVPINAL